MLYIEMLGRVRVSFGTLRESLSLRHQSIVLLAHFAICPAHRVARETLVERFWPDQSLKIGQHSLSSAIWRLRRGLAQAGDVIVGDDHGEAGFADTADMWLDTRALSDAIRPALTGNGRLDHAATEGLTRGLDLYRGDLLEGFYDDWVLAERERLRAYYLRGRLRLLEHHAAADDWDSAMESGREILRLDPLREDVHRRMMELYIRNGERSAARRQYDRLTKLLKDELGVDPDPETRAVYLSV